MNTNAVVVVLCALSLGATCWVATSMPKPDDGRVAELEKKLEAAEKRADAAEALKTQMREMSERLDRRIGELEQRVAEPRSTPGVGAAGGGVAARPVAPDGKPLEDVVADRVEKKVAERLEAMSNRDKERGEDGKWKAPLDDLAVELKLSDAQKAEAKKIFDHVRDEAFTLLKTQRLDGGSLLDDYAAALKSGADVAETTRQFFGKIMSDKVPGTAQTYLAEFITMHQDAEDQLAHQLDAGQMKRLKSLRVDLLDVKTGYDPVGDYVRAKVQ